MAKPLLALLVAASALCAVGCDDTPGVKDQAPPPGGPPKQERHPPGLNKDDLKKYQ
ncbi:MAG: hypothetical protein ACO1SV_10070 [Fimbriimonas sp.]